MEDSIVGSFVLRLGLIVMVVGLEHFDAFSEAGDAFSEAAEPSVVLHVEVDAGPGVMGVAVELVVFGATVGAFVHGLGILSWVGDFE